MKNVKSLLRNKMARMKSSQTPDPEGRDTVSLAKIGWRLRKFQSYPELIQLAKRLFQKEPTIIQELEEILEHVPSNLKVASTRHEILKVIESALDKRLRNQ